MNKKKVVLGMSGGTDSSMSAIMLQEAGFEVIGVTFLFYGEEGQHLQDARNLAQSLGIKHITYEARELFKSTIIDYFIDEYYCGRTPVPCIICNNIMKWPLLAKIANEHNAYYISTGHYIQTTEENDKIYITPGIDPEKDQSFFMWGLPTDILRRMLLPLGDKKKEDVRALAAEKGYKRVSVKKDSLGVCFCSGDYRDFLKEKASDREVLQGYFYDNKGKIIGKHEGFPYYTVGQRRGLGINLNQALYVKEIHPSENKILLAPHSELFKNVMLLEDVHCNYPDDLSPDKEVICRIRYRKQNTPCHVTLLPGNKARVVFNEPLDAIAPGQAAAFYKDNKVIGGGIIHSAE